MGEDRATTTKEGQGSQIPFQIVVGAKPGVGSHTSVHRLSLMIEAWAAATEDRAVEEVWLCPIPRLLRRKLHALKEERGGGVIIHGVFDPSQSRNNSTLTQLASLLAAQVDQPAATLIFAGQSRFVKAATKDDLVKLVGVLALIQEGISG